MKVDFVLRSIPSCLQVPRTSGRISHFHDVCGLAPEVDSRPARSVHAPVCLVDSPRAPRMMGGVWFLSHFPFDQNMGFQVFQNSVFFLESNSSPLLITHNVQLVEPCIIEAIGNEPADDILIPFCVITHVYLTMLTGDCGWVVLLVSARVSLVPSLQTGHNEYPKS